MAVACPKCGAKLSIPKTEAGKRVRCPKCRAKLHLVAEGKGAAQVEAGSSSVASNDDGPPRPEAAVDTSRRLAAEDVIGGCRIEEMLGAGAMGVVYTARQLSLNRQVALKVLTSKLSGKRRFVERFDAESAALATLNHPNIVSIYDRGQEQGTYYFIMEYVQGKTLRQIMDEGTMPTAQVLQVMEQVLSALGYAHRRGIVHRDIKPGNIMVNEQGAVKIADFGLAFLVGEEDTKGKLYGTRGYMAPEQVRGDANVDGRADLYAAAVVLYQMLTGHRPDVAWTEPRQHRPEVSPALEYVLLRGLQERLDYRYQNPSEFLADMRMSTQGKGEFLAACVQCGSPNPPTETRCANCGSDLSDLFEACPQCQHSNRLDASACANCGGNLTGYRQQLWAEAEQIRARARELEASGQFDAAAEELKRLAGFPGQEFRKVAVSAQTLIDHLYESRGSVLGDLKEKGVALCTQHKYAEALLVLQALPKDEVDVSSQITHAKAQMEQRAAWADEGDVLWKEGDVPAALDAYSKAFETWPDNDDLAERVEQAEAAAKHIAEKTRVLDEIRSLREAGRFEEAIGLCGESLTKWPRSPGLSKLFDQTHAERAATQACQATAIGDEMAGAGKWGAALKHWSAAQGQALDPKAQAQLEADIAKAKGILLRRYVIAGGVALVVTVLLAIWLAG